LGPPIIENKILQSAVKTLLEPIFEQDAHVFTYGFRPGKLLHQAKNGVWKYLMDNPGGCVQDSRPPQPAASNPGIKRKKSADYVLAWSWGNKSWQKGVEPASSSFKHALMQGIMAAGQGDPGNLLKQLPSVGFTWCCCFKNLDHVSITQDSPKTRGTL